VAVRQGGGGKSPRGALEAASADLADVPESHPRRKSLEMRQRLVAAVESGLAHPSGLTAHGRGEAFDYLLGERTVEEAEAAERAGA
jgi:4-phosphopantoate---beta-alanine ligase